MSDIKNKNFSFRASVFSTKLFSIIAATMLLLLVDGTIHDAPAPTDDSLTTVNNISKRSSASFDSLRGAKLPTINSGAEFLPPSGWGTPYPQGVCEFLFNGRNVCTEETVTAVVAGLALGAIAGLVTLAQWELNQSWNSAKQRENTNNLLMHLLLTQQKNGGGGGGYVPPPPP